MDGGQWTVDRRLAQALARLAEAERDRRVLARRLQATSEFSSWLAQNNLKIEPKVFGPDEPAIGLALAFAADTGG